MTMPVPSALQAHLDKGATTMTLLMRVDPQNAAYSPFGCTLLDRDVTFDDGELELVYRAPIGMIPATMVAAADMGVNNSEIQHLIPEGDLDVNEEALNAGAYDFAWYTLYWVNYEDLSMGFVVLDHGQLGQVRVQNGVTFWSELTSLSKLLKTPIVEKDSITCRAIFGSQPIGTGGGVVEQRFPCGKDAEALFTGPHAVTEVGFEASRTFRAAALGLPENTCVPGMLVWLTGANAGRTHEVEAQDAAGVISMTFETMFPVQVGDTFKIRPDCTKWKEGPNGCKFHFPGQTWKLHYRGEPHIPISDGDALNTPGATVSLKTV